MTRRRRLALVALASLVLLLAGAWAFLTPIVRTLVWPSILAKIEESTGLHALATLEQLDVANGVVRVAKVDVGVPSGALAARAKEIVLRFEPRTLASDRVRIDGISASDVEIEVDADRWGDLEADLEKLRAGGGGGAALDRVAIASGVVRLRRRGRTLEIGGVRGDATFRNGELAGASLEAAIGACRLDFSLADAMHAHAIARAPAPPVEILELLDLPPALLDGATRIEADVGFSGGRIDVAVRVHADSIALPSPLGRTPLDADVTLETGERRIAVVVERARSRLVELADVRATLDLDARRATLDRPAKLAFDLEAVGSPVPGRADATVTRLEASSAGDVVGSADVEVRDVALSAGPASLRGGGNVSTDVERTADGRWSASANGTVGEVILAPALGGGSARPSVRATARGASGSSRIDLEAAVGADGFGRFDVTLRLEHGRAAAGTLEAADVPASRLLPAARGTLEASLRYDRGEAPQSDRLAGDVLLRGGGIAAGAAEADAVDADVNVSCDRSGSAVEWTAKGRAAGFLAVAQKYSLDASATPVTFDADGRIDLDADRLEVRGARAAIGALGRAEASATVSRLRGERELSAHGTIALPDLSEVFRKIVAPNVVDAAPSAAALEVAGALDAVIDARAGAASPPSVRGSLSLRDVSVRGQTFAVEELNASLPLGLGERAPDDAATLAARVLRIGPTTATDVRLSLRHNGDQWTNASELEPIRFDAFGGTVSVTGLALRSLGVPGDVAGKATLVGRVAIDGVRASHVFPDFAASHAFEAVMRTPADLAVSLSLARLAVHGDTLVGAFGGTVRIGDLIGEPPFGPLARFKTSLSAWDVDLEQISKLFDYGDVRGIVQVDVPYFWIGSGEVERFLARFATVEGRSRQLVGLKTLRKIPFLSEKGRLTLQGHLANFIGSFRYSRLGAALALQNGIFQFHGRYDDDGNDLFGTPDRFRWPLRRVEGVEELLLVPSGWLPRLRITVNPATYGVSWAEFVNELRSARAKAE
jgi:hypothetical protein